MSQSGLSALLTALSEKEDLIDILNNEVHTLVGIVAFLRCAYGLAECAVAGEGARPL